MFFFKPSKKELQTVFEELIETKKNMFIDVLREAKFMICRTILYLLISTVNECLRILMN